MHKQVAFNQIAHKLFLAITLMGLTIVLSYLFPRFGFIVFTPIFGTVFLLIIVAYELRVQQSYKRSSLLVRLIVLSIPLQAVLIRTIPILLAAQLSIFFVFLFYLQIFTPQDRVEFLRKIRPLILPTLAFACSIILSYLVAGNLQRNDWVFLLSLLGSVGYAYLACIYCTSIQNIKRILWILIAIGVIQLPFLIAQSRGWTDWLPANLHMFTSTAWGGTASSISVLRYGGMFADYELLAEYLDIAVFLCVGMLMFTSTRRERIFAVLSLCLVLTAGFYTGTRAFIFGIGIGLAVMVFLMVIRPSFDKKLVNLLLIGSVLVLSLYFLSTQKMFSGYIDRFFKTDIRVGYYDTRNTVWSISFHLMQKIPFTGYGAQMMNIFNSNAFEVFTSPHSLYFFMFLTAGYPGLIAIFFMVLAPVIWMMRIIFNKTKKIYVPLAIVLLSIWTFWLINEIKIEFTRYPFYLNIIFFLFGIIASFYSLAFRKPVDINSHNHVE